MAKPGQIKHPEELIDVLHQVLLLWEKSRREEILEVLKETGYGRSDVFYKVAQAISGTLPNDNKEKKLLDGFFNLEIAAFGRASKACVYAAEFIRSMKKKNYTNGFIFLNFLSIKRLCCISSE